MYRLLFRSVFSHIDPERAHYGAFRAIRIADRIPPVALLLSVLTASRPGERATVMGLEFPNRVGLAAGFDKNAHGVRALGRLGFGSIEIGTVTGHAQPGNPRPRLFRLVQDFAVINRMGFNNDGARKVSYRLARQRRLISRLPASQRPIVGVNIGKTKVVSGESAVLRDYVASTKTLAPLADYLVINVSSPNTPGLRDLQSVEALRPLIEAVRSAAAGAVPEPASTLGHVPLMVKIAPDLAAEDVSAIVDLALELGIDGLILSNTTISRAGLNSADSQVKAIGAGGLSGRPLAARSMDVLRAVRAQAGERLTLVSVGGIESPADVRARLAAGADLVQGYTAFIYRGPFWAAKVRAGGR